MSLLAEEKNKKGKSYIKGAAGALLCALAASTPWAFLFYHGWVPGWLGLVIGYASVLGYGFFGGKTGRAKIWIVGTAAFFGVATGNCAYDIYDFAQLIYCGEIDYATYRNIPMLYIYWLEDPDVLKEVLFNLSVGLVFAAVSLFSINKEIQKELNPKESSAEKHEEDNEDEETSSEKDKLPVYRRFTVSENSFRMRIMFLIVIVVLTAGPLLGVFYNDMKKESIFVLLFSSLIVFFAIALPFGIYIYKLKRLKVEVSGNSMKVTSAFKAEKFIHVSEITKAKETPYLFGITQQPNLYYLKVYVNGKMLFSIMSTLFKGTDELCLWLKENNVPYYE